MHKLYIQILTIHPFKKTNYSTYKSWHKDHQLNKALAPLDKEWLNHILHNDKGRELAIFSDAELVAVVGITNAHEDHDFRAITNIAVKPTLRNQGLGRNVLAMLFEEVSLEAGGYWVAYVDYDNPGAQAFFTKEGWTRIEEVDMIRFEFRGERRL